MLLALLVTAPAALADGRDVLADAQDNGRVDACYTRAEFNEALALIRDDQRLYGDLRDVIEQEGLISRVKVPGQPCGSARRVPSEAVDDTGGASPALWASLIAAVGVVGAGAGLWARRRGDG
jgi:hypothetical protein